MRPVGRGARRRVRLPSLPMPGILDAALTPGGLPVIPISVQLYTIRDQTAQDFAGSMKQVAAIGYPSVELAGYGNLKTAKEAKKALDDAGLKVAGTHAPIEQLEDEGKLQHV